MHSLVVLPTDTLGGAERVLKTLTRALAAKREGVDVVFLSKADHGSWRDLPPNVTLHFTEAPNEKLGLLPGTRLVRTLSSTRSYSESLSSHAHINSWLGTLRLARVLQTRRMVFRESTMMARRFTGVKLAAIRALYYVGYHAADLVICQTDEMLRELRNFVPLSRRWNAHVIPNPVEADLGRTLAKRAVDPDPASLAPYVVTAGRLIPEKGVDVLLKAFADLATGHDDLRLVILGDGPQHEALQQDAIARGLANRVEFLGRVSNPHAYFAAAELGVVSSRIEGFPNVLLEMLAVCGRVVSTRCADGIDAIAGLRTCPPGHASQLLAVMRAALDEPAGAHAEEFTRELARRSPRRFLESVEGALGGG